MKNEKRKVPAIVIDMEWAVNVGNSLGIKSLKWFSPGSMNGPSRVSANGSLWRTAERPEVWERGCKRGIGCIWLLSLYRFILLVVTLANAKEKMPKIEKTKIVILAKLDPKFRVPWDYTMIWRDLIHDFEFYQFLSNI